VPGGDVLAIMGAAGAGKSSLLNLVAGLLDPAEGEVVVDEQPLAERTLRSRFRAVGMVSRDLPLMRGTLRRNVTYRNPEASYEEINRVLLACHLDQLLARLPEGLDAWLTESGRNISAGERQRIALARALMGDPPILLLDEPTANLDEASKEVFRRVIAHHQGTVLLVTHDPNEAALADEVWTMEDGHVIEAVPGDEFRDRLWAVRQKRPQRVQRPDRRRSLPQGGPVEAVPPEDGPRPDGGQAA
jgi:ATP-binding cassette, subfamily B, bacterial